MEVWVPWATAWALFQVVGAAGTTAAFTGFLQGGQQDCSQDGDDRDHDQQLDKSESTTLFHFLFFLSFCFKRNSRFLFFGTFTALTNLYYTQKFSKEQTFNS